MTPNNIYIIAGAAGAVALALLLVALFAAVVAYRMGYRGLKFKEAMKMVTSTTNDVAKLREDFVAKNPDYIIALVYAKDKDGKIVVNQELMNTIPNGKLPIDERSINGLKKLQEKGFKVKESTLVDYKKLTAEQQKEISAVTVKADAEYSGVNPAEAKPGITPPLTGGQRENVKLDVTVSAIEATNKDVDAITKDLLKDKADVSKGGIAGVEALKGTAKVVAIKDKDGRLDDTNVSKGIQVVQTTEPNKAMAVIVSECDGAKPTDKAVAADPKMSGIIVSADVAANLAKISDKLSAEVRAAGTEDKETTDIIIMNKGVSTEVKIKVNTQLTSEILYTELTKALKSSGLAKEAELVKGTQTIATKTVSALSVTDNTGRVHIIPVVAENAKLVTDVAADLSKLKDDASTAFVPATATAGEAKAAIVELLTKAAKGKDSASIYLAKDGSIVAAITSLVSQLSVASVLADKQNANTDVNTAIVKQVAEVANCNVNDERVVLNFDKTQLNKPEEIDFTKDKTGAISLTDGKEIALKATECSVAAKANTKIVSSSQAGSFEDMGMGAYTDLTSISSPAA